MGSEAGHDADPADAAGKIADLMNGVFASLDETVVTFREHSENATTHGRRLRRSDLSALHPVLFHHLQRHQDLIMGTGVVVAPASSPTRRCGSSGGERVRARPRRP